MEHPDSRLEIIFHPVSHIGFGSTAGFGKMLQIGGVFELRSQVGLPYPVVVAYAQDQVSSIGADTDQIFRHLAGNANGTGTQCPGTSRQ